MKSRIAKGEDLKPTEFSGWTALAQQMVEAVLTDSANTQKYFSYGLKPEHRKPSACFSLNVGIDDFALCIEAENIVKQAEMDNDSVQRFMDKWKDIPKLDRVTRDAAEEAILMERRARFEKELAVCKLEAAAAVRETCIVNLENSYLDEKYGVVEEKKLVVKTVRRVFRERKYESPMTAKDNFFDTSGSSSLSSYVRTGDVDLTNYVNLFDVPCPDSEYGSLCTQFCCQEGSEHDLFCNLLIECY